MAIRLSVGQPARGQRGPYQAVGVVLRRAAGSAASLPPTHEAGLVRCPVADCEAMLCLPLHSQENTMGKYLLAWLLGVPGIVLLLVYLFFH